MSTALLYLGLELALIGFVWSTVRLVRSLGWIRIAKTSLDDPPFVLIVLDAVLTILAVIFSP